MESDDDVLCEDDINSELFTTYEKYKEARDYKNALRLLLYLAEKNQPDSMYEIWFCYRYGVYVEQNEEIAFYWLRRGDWEEGCLLHCIRNIIYNADEPSEAIQLLEENAQQRPMFKDDYFVGHGQLMGAFLKNGEGGRISQALNSFHRSSDDSNDFWSSESTYWIAKTMSREQIPLFKEKSTIQWYEESAYSGFVPAMVKVGKCYADGRHCVVSLFRAWVFFNLAKQNGSTKAEHLLTHRSRGFYESSKAHNYVYWLNVDHTVNSFLSIKRFKKESTKGYMNEFFHVIPYDICLRIGSYVWSTADDQVWEQCGKLDKPQLSSKIQERALEYARYKTEYANGNYDEALMSLRYAAEFGHADAMCELAYHLKYGTLKCPTDDQRWCEKWLLGSVTRSSSKGWFDLYETRDDVFPLHEDTIGYFNELEETFYEDFEHFVACTNDSYTLGKMFGTGTYLEQCDHQAFSLFLKGAEPDQPYQTHCEYEIGCCYERGIGVSENIDKALRWYTKAATKRHAIAQFAMMHLCQKNETKNEKKKRKIVQKSNTDSQYWCKQLLKQCVDDGAHTLQLLEEERRFDIKQQRVKNALDCFRRVWIECIKRHIGPVTQETCDIGVMICDLVATTKNEKGIWDY